MSGDHLERLEALLRHYREDDDAEMIDAAGDDRLTVGMLRAALDELKQLREEREGWVRGASQRLRHAYRTGWDDRGESVAAALAAVAGFTSAEQRAAAYAAEWWDRGAALAAKIRAAATSQQPTPDGEA